MAWKTQSNRIVPPDWDARKRAVRQRDGGTCHVCGHPGADEVDHILNVARGGSHELDNLAMIHGGTCRTCMKRCHISKTAHESRLGRASRKRTPEPHPACSSHAGQPSPHRGRYPTRGTRPDPFRIAARIMRAHSPVFFGLCRGGGDPSGWPWPAPSRIAPATVPGFSGRRGVIVLPEVSPEGAVPAALERVVDAVVLHRAYSSVPGGAGGSLYDTAAEAYRGFFRDMGVAIDEAVSDRINGDGEITVSELLDLFINRVSTAVVVEMTSAVSLVQLLAEALGTHTGSSAEAVLAEVLEKAKG